jgi:TRAP-type C4-dicarboxylate transport system permease large subunit
VPVPDPSFGWQDATAAFAIIAVVAFLVTWVVTDLGHVSRTPYVAILTVTTFGLGAGYIAWSGTSVADLVTAGWVWGILGGLVAAAMVVPLVRRLPAGRLRPQGSQLVGRLLWEGVVYGFAEGVLLATLPVLAVWQATDALGWTDTTWAKVGSGVLAVVGALCVILVHHLGYREFRTRAARKMLRGALVGCGLQALAFLLTGNVLAPVVAHIVLHTQLTLRGNEMPPVAETRLAPPGPGLSRPTKGTAPEKELVA